MANSFISMNIHFVFSTTKRKKLIDKEMQQRLWPYLGGIARQNNMVAYAVGGIEDHIHILVSIPATMTVSKAIQLIKAGSSKWIHETYPEKRDFKWQTGYSAFSVSNSNKGKVIYYIQNQDEHHKQMTFQKEYLAFLVKNGIQYNERYVWG